MKYMRHEIFLFINKMILFPDEPIVFTVASEAKDGYLRFLRSANEYDIKVS